MRLQVNGVCYHIEVAGAGDPPLLCLHGFTGSAESWRAHMPNFAEAGRVIAIDFLGHGKSDAPVESARYGMERTVEDLTAILDALDAPRVNVLGYSMGGRVALVFALTHPERVHALILESSSPGLENEAARQERRKSDFELAERIEREGVEKFVEVWTNIPLFESQRQLPETVRVELKRQRLDNSPVGLANSLRGLSVGAQDSYWAQLHNLAIPTLLVAGELDAKYNAVANDMAQAMPRAQVVIVPQAGHTVHLEQPQVFDKLVLEFLKEKGPRIGA